MGPESELDFINHAIFCYNNIDMLVVRFDGNLGDDLIFKGKRNLAGRDCQPGDESIVISYSRADSSAFFIQGDCGYNGNVDALNGDDLAACLIRLQNAPRPDL